MNFWLCTGIYHIMNEYHLLYSVMANIKSLLLILPADFSVARLTIRFLLDNTVYTVTKCLNGIMA